MKPSESITYKPVDLEALTKALYAEFDRLNAVYFGRQLTMPEIVVSARKTYGGYYYPKDHKIVLSLQAYYEHGWEETLNTFRHEVAHIVHPNHSDKFWNLAYAIGVTKRYASSPKAAAPKKEPRYIYVCDSCGSRVPKYRRIKPSSCAVCDTQFNLKYLLRLLPPA